MLYPKEPSLAAELFRHPTAAYRAAPFWAWNCKLEKEKLDWQMPVFQKMGMGGFHMHVRTGLDTPYLSDEFMERIRQCVNWAAAHDMCAYLYALDDELWQPMEELLRIRQKFHRRLGWQTNERQPWRLPAEKSEYTIRLRFRFQCAQATSGCQLAMEKREEASFWLDGQPIVPIENGWYVDPRIKTSELPCLSAGSHTLEVIRPFTPRTCLEWVYLLENFHVKLSGQLTMLEPVQEEKAGYASLTEQGIPFYGGNVSYVFDIETHGGALRLRVPHWRGALIAASIDGQDVGRIAFPPYSIETSPFPAGMHQICLKLFGTRANTFGPLHLADEKETWIGPGAWCNDEDAWTYEYRLKPF